MLVVRVVDPSFEEDSASADCFGIFRDEGALLRGGRCGEEEREGQQKSIESACHQANLTPQQYFTQNCGRGRSRQISPDYRIGSC